MRPTMHVHAQRGTSLVEALVACLVLALGLVAMGRMQMVLRQHADDARQRTEAVQLAQEDIETLRSFSTLAASAGGRSYEQIRSDATTVERSTQLALNTSYTVQRSVTEGGGFRNATVEVSWADRRGQTQRVILDSTIAATPALFSGALALQSSAQPLKRVRGRSAFVPVTAKDLGDGTSALKPSGAAGFAWIFDNASGAPRSRCMVAASTSTASLTVADLGQCTALAGSLLSGLVRFSFAAPPDPRNANDGPLPMSMNLTLNPAVATPPECIAEARKLVGISTADGTRRESVALAATPAALGVTSWVDLGERFVAYHCVVPPVAGGWSGVSSVVPQGWTIGSSAADFKVCRYAADHDGSGAVDSNAEHPGAYSHVNGTLMQQNFLIIRGDQACAVATVQHQP